MDRWTWITLKGKKPNITLVQLYILSDVTDPGIFTTFAQQYEKIQLNPPEENPQVFRTYYKDLNQFLTTIDHDVILMGNFDVPTSDPYTINLQSQHNLLEIYNTTIRTMTSTHTK